jgi:hypothetical protein
MLTFELVSKKRKPIKRYAFAGIIIGFMILILIGLTGRWLNDAISVALMILVACIFIACLYIINYSVKFKNVIGQISFFENYIEVILNRGKEIIYIDNIRSIRFKLAGYEGLNSTTFFEYLLWFPAYFSYKNGMNNFVSISTSTGVRQFELYIPDKKHMSNIRELAQNYHSQLSKS